MKGTIVWLFMFSRSPYSVKAEPFTNAIRAYLQQCIGAEKIKCGIVVGLVDEHGSSIVSCGKLITELTRK